MAAVSSDHGVDLLSDGGKVVWCCVNSPAEAMSDYLAVTLLGLSPTLWCAAREHHDALLRELALVQAFLPEDEQQLLANDLAAAGETWRQCHPQWISS